MTYELWFNPTENTYTFFPSSNTHAYELLEKDSELLHMFSANTWEEAQQMHYDYLNLNKYKYFNDNNN